MKFLYLGEFLLGKEGWWGGGGGGGGGGGVKSMHLMCACKRAVIRVSDVCM